MALWSLTHERVEVLRAELAAKEAELQALLKKSDPNPNPNPDPNQALLGYITLLLALVRARPALKAFLGRALTLTPNP